MKQATFAAGCFWDVEATFREVEGVVETAVGYTGGHAENPTHEEVSIEQTGHAEAVRVEFDPNVVAYEQLLGVFWSCHDPTRLNAQGSDVGTQYRSAIFCHSDEQREAAEQSKEALAKSGKHQRPIVTQIVAATTFYRAAEEHQRYFEKHDGGQCHR